ncbi:diadenosine 5'5'''-P1,P4-tetraphosphate pyrophosphohydrolase [Rugamonas sp. R1(2021)]
MPISGKPNTDGLKPRILSAGVVVQHRGAQGCRYLLLRSYQYWDFPKGLVEAGESPLSAACREVREETSLDALEFPWGYAFRETPPYGQGKVARYYLAQSHSDDVRLPVNPQLGRPEHHAFRWLPYAAARDLLPLRLIPVLDWAHALTEG